MFKTIIIDDEILARKRLSRLLEPFSDTIEIIAEAVDGEDGLEKIELNKPDLIFLDIEMPLLTGLEMLNKLSHNPIVVFATAYEEYAIKAFEKNSIDYLLKPIEKDRLTICVDKLKRFGNFGFDKKLLQTDIQINREVILPKSFPIKVGDKTILIKLEEISFFEADEKYVFINTKAGARHLSDFTLSFLEKKLSQNFLRIHRGIIINADAILELHRGFNGSFTIVLNDANKTKVQSSRSYADALRNLTEF